MLYKGFVGTLGATYIQVAFIYMLIYICTYVYPGRVYTAYVYAYPGQRPAARLSWSATINGRRAAYSPPRPFIVEYMDGLTEELGLGPCGGDGEAFDGPKRGRPRYPPLSARVRYLLRIWFRRRSPRRAAMPPVDPQLHTAYSMQTRSITTGSVVSRLIYAQRHTAAHRTDLG